LRGELCEGEKSVKNKEIEEASKLNGIKDNNFYGRICSFKTF